MEQWLKMLSIFAEYQKDTDVCGQIVLLIPSEDK